MGIVQRVGFLSSVGLIIIGTAIALDGLQSFFGHVVSPPTEAALHGLAVVVTMGYLLFAGAFIAVGIVSARQHRPPLGTATFVWASILVGTFLVSTFPITTDTQTDIGVRLVIATVPAVVTWAVVRRAEPPDEAWRHQRERVSESTRRSP